MKRIILVLLCFITTGSSFGQIIADHTVVDLYDQIPSNWIDSVKKMWVVYAGESHSWAIQIGLARVEALNSNYDVSVTESGTPEAYTTSHLRASRATWGDHDNASGWIYDYGEEDWWTNSTAISMTEAGFEYCNDNNLTIGAIGFGWCWDAQGAGPTDDYDSEYGCRWWGASVDAPDGNKAWGLDASDYSITSNSVSMNTYCTVTQGYVDFCETNNIPTTVFFTTGPVDNWGGTYSDENMYQASIKYDYIRDYVAGDPTRILFDYADILCYDDGSDVENTVTWDGHTYPRITDANCNPVGDAHISSIGETRLGKAMWWLLARIAGWDGYPVTEWTGIAGPTWDEEMNWTNGVPDETRNVIIGEGADVPVIEAGMTADCHDIEIKSDGLLTIESNAVYSGSLIVNGTASGNVTFNRQMPDDALYHYVSSPVSSLTLPSSALFWAWDEQSGDWGDPVTSCESGRGYTMQANNNLISFTGSIINTAGPLSASSPYSDCDFPEGGIVLYSERPFASGRDNTLNYGGGGWNLLGNPFTCALNATEFIAYNSAGFDQNYKALYIYNGSTYSYIGSELTGWENADGIFSFTNVQAGQGFFVAARCNSSAFSFTSDMQTHATNVPLTKSTGSSDKWPGVEIKAKCATGESSTLIVYNDKMSTGLDPGYDVGMMGAGGGISLYTTFPCEDNEVFYVRQSLPIAGIDAVFVPVGIDIEGGGEVTFSAESEAVPGKKFWLEDREAGVFTDLTTQSYTITLPSNTYGTGRFYIVCSANTPTTVNVIEEDDNIRIWASSGKVIIKGKVSDRAVCELFDLQGRIIQKKILEDNAVNTVSFPSGFSGVCLVRVSDGLKTITRKVAVVR